MCSCRGWWLSFIIAGSYGREGWKAFSILLEDRTDANAWCILTTTHLGTLSFRVKRPTAGQISGGAKCQTSQGYPRRLRKGEDDQHPLGPHDDRVPRLEHTHATGLKLATKNRSLLQSMMLYTSVISPHRAAITFGLRGSTISSTSACRQGTAYKSLWPLRLARIALIADHLERLITCQRS